MRTVLRLLTLCLACLTLILALSACRQASLAGTWHGDGTLHAEGPFARAQTLILHEDGSGFVTTATGQKPLTYRYTDDTLTLSFESRGSWGLGYRCQGNTLTLLTESGSAVFTKAS